MIQIVGFCRHKVAGWEGVIYTKGDGETWVSSGSGFWRLTSARETALERVEAIDIVRLCGDLRGCPSLVESESAKELVQLLAS